MNQSSNIFGLGERVVQRVFSAICVLLVAANAQAGETLHLKQGAVNTANVSANASWVIQALNETKTIDTSIFVVQFKEKIRPEDRRNLETLGAQILRYLPDDAFIVRASASQMKTIAKASQAIRTTIPYLAQWKISPDFEVASIFNAEGFVQVLVRLFPNENSQVVQEKIQKIAGIQIEYSSSDVLLVKARNRQLTELSKVDGIEWLQEQPKMESFHAVLEDEVNPEPQGLGDYLDLTGYESGTKAMKFSAAHSRGYMGAGQVVAMADTGMDRGDITNVHGDFAGRIKSGFAFGMFSTSWEDPMGHGTHVAGSVTGDGAISKGKIQGGAYKAQFIPEGMWSPMLNNLSVPPKLADLFGKAKNDGARIHTNSWGSPMSLGAYDSMAQQVDEYMYKNPEFLIIFAAGNSGVDKDGDGRIDPGSVSSPGTAKNALTVGASENLVKVGGIQKALKELKDGTSKWGVEPLASDTLSNNIDGLAAFSSRGPTRDGRIKPEVVAPGTNILSTRSHQKDAEKLWGEYNSEYLWCGGTSMATPLVAGGATVVREYLVKAKGLTNPSAAAVKATLMHTADDLFPGQFGFLEKGQEILKARPNADEGFGRVNMDRSTALQSSIVVDERTGLATGDKHMYPVKVTASSKMTVTLVYTDAPAAADAAKTLVNDLDLSIVNVATGETKALADHVNNFELFEANVTPGEYEVRVMGGNVPQGLNGKQPYALLVSVQ